MYAAQTFVSNCPSDRGKHIFGCIFNAAVGGICTDKWTSINIFNIYRACAKEYSKSGLQPKFG